MENDPNLHSLTTGTHPGAASSPHKSYNPKADGLGTRGSGRRAARAAARTGAARPPRVPTPAVGSARSPLALHSNAEAAPKPRDNLSHVKLSPTVVRTTFLDNEINILIIKLIHHSPVLTHVKVLKTRN